MGVQNEKIWAKFDQQFNFEFNFEVVQFDCVKCVKDFWMVQVKDTVFGS